MTHFSQQPTIVEILGGLRRLFDGPDYVAMLWAYFDDSSDSKRQRICAAGGFFTVDSRWHKLDIAWRRATRELKEPFRSTDCETGHGQFENWPKPKRDALMADLCELVKSFDLGAFGSAVSVPDYLKLFPEADLYDPYLLCLSMCFANVAEITELSNRVIAENRIPLPAMNVHYWVEENPVTAGRETQIYHDIKAVKLWSSACRMQDMAHLGKQVIGLQAADLIAREVFKFYDNAGVRPVRKPVLSLAKHVTFHRWSADNLAAYAELTKKTNHATAVVSFARELSTLTKDNPIQPGVFVQS